jgi:Tol biopolymer transport system component
MRQAVLAVVVLSATVLGSVTTAGATSGSGRNGRVLYSETYRYAYGSGSLYAINPNGSGRVLITNNTINGSWSPDVKHVLFESARQGDLDL